MKLLPWILAVVFGLLFAVSLFFSINTMITLSRALLVASRQGEPRQFHGSVYLPASGTTFFERIISGSMESAREQNIALTVHRVEPGTRDFRFAQYTGVDGVVVHPAIDHPELEKILEVLDSARIAVVLTEQGVRDDWPWSLVGTNSFDVGRRIAELAADSVQGFVHLAVIYSDKSPGIASERELVELGISTTLADRRGGPLLRKQTGLNPLEAENLVYRILRDEPHINVLAFTDPADTLAAMQVIVDLNLVGRVQIVGFGHTSTIQDYLDQNLLVGTIVVNPRQIGLESIRSLTGMIRDGHSPGYVDTGVQVLRGRQ